jgi:Holliday junction DNA helicase RuvB
VITALRLLSFIQLLRFNFDDKNYDKAGIITDHGLSANDIVILKTLKEKFGGGPTGVKNLAAATGEDEGTIEDVVEPYLIQLGLIERTPRGRVLTEKGREYLEK